MPSDSTTTDSTTTDGSPISPLPAENPHRAIDLDPKLWQRLFSPARKEWEDRQILAQQLRRWCEGNGRADAALYGESTDGYKLQVRAGKAPFPEELRADEAPAGDGAEPWARLELPAALLLCSPPVPAAPDSDLLLLAAGARISSLKRELQEQSFQAMFRGVELEALYDVGLAIASTLDLDKLYDEVLLRAVSLLDARRGALYLLEDGHYRLSSRFGGAARESFPRDELRRVDGEYRGPKGWLPGAVHALAVPVEIEGDPRGLLVVADKESRRGVGPFPTNDRRTLALFANQAAIALENAKLHRLALEKERLEREMELAAEIQQQLLPKAMPEIPGYEVLGWNRPARQVGGDYFDVAALGDGRWGLVVGDVTGKGMPAALLVSTLHSALRLLTDRLDVGPALLDRLNRHVCESSGSNKFITLLLAEIDSRDGRLSYLNAGHNCGLLLRRAGDVVELPAGGLPLGLLPHGRYEARSLTLGPGDLLCLYSDGITECTSPDEEELGLARLQTLLREHHTEPLGRILERIDRAVVDFAQGQPQGDDQTVVLLRRRAD